MRRLSSTFFKFFLSNLFIILLLSWLFLTFSIKSAERFYIEQMKEDLHKLSIAIYDSFKSLLIKEDLDKIDRLCKSYGEKTGIRITLIRVDGVVLGDSYKDPKQMENHINRPEIQEALKKGTGSSLRYSTTLKRYLLYYTIPIKDEEKIIGFLRVSLFLEKIIGFLDKIKWDMINLIALLFICASFAALILSRTLTRPIEEIAKGVSEIAKGNFRVRLSDSGKGELAYLSRHINKMAKKLEWLFNELTREKEELNAIVEGLYAGLVVINKEGNMLMANRSFKEMVEKSEIENRPYWEVLRESDLSRFIQELRKNPKNTIKEIIIKDRPYICSATFIKEDKIILIFYDISPVKEMERLKRDLVTSVSHELKTPLTAIKGYVETLLEDTDDSEKRYYLDIINRHVDRLSNIINDLLYLSFLETKRELYIEKVDLEALIKKISELFLSKIKEKGLEFKVEIDPDARFIYADEFKLEQAILNLIDNAIKYTEKGYVAVMIRSKDHDKISITIKDTGIGIPKEHVPYIFERFYVVDKSRSRATGGTGLGLSIVKHVIQLHRGDIKVETSIGKGTSFVITLPRKN